MILDRETPPELLYYAFPITPGVREQATIANVKTAWQTVCEDLVGEQEHHIELCRTQKEKDICFLLRAPLTFIFEN